MRSFAPVVALLGSIGCNEPARDAPPPPPAGSAAPAAAPVATTCTPNDHVCRGDALVECGADGQLGATLQTCKDGCKGGACADACATQGNALVYVLTDDDQLFSFDPDKLSPQLPPQHAADAFHRIGALACGVGEPNSMAVDHSGIAWVIDHHSHLFRASILDAHCTAAGAVAVAAGATAPATFGMGFASTDRRTPGNTAETLYVAADDNSDHAGASTLARLDLAAAPITYQPIAAIGPRGRSMPELSGTGDGQLFGYFPLATQGGFIQQLDRATGAAIGARWMVPSRLGVKAWAFAQWGGSFYVFATTIDNNSQVHAIRRATGAYKLVGDHLPFAIVGAGVSTCAPELERAAP